MIVPSLGGERARYLSKSNEITLEILTVAIFRPNSRIRLLYGLTRPLRSQAYEMTQCNEYSLLRLW